MAPPSQVLDSDKDEALLVTNQDPTQQEGADQEMEDGEVSYLVKGLLGLQHLVVLHSCGGLHGCRGPRTPQGSQESSGVPGLPRGPRSPQGSQESPVVPGVSHCVCVAVTHGHCGCHVATSQAVWAVLVVCPGSVSWLCVLGLCPVGSGSRPRRAELEGL